MPTLIALGGCSSLFFYPDRQHYFSPDRLDLAYNDIWIDTSDGEQLHAWWLPAQGDPLGNIYYLHGNAQNISAHIFNVAWLPVAGYNVLMIDYRGFGRSTGNPTIEGALEDAVSGLRWMSAQETTDNLPVYLLGQSLGGALAIPLAEKWQNSSLDQRLAGVVLDSTFAGFRRIAREKLGAFWLTWPLQLPLSWTVSDQFEGVSHIAGISPTPIMVIHSERDHIIPLSHGKELYNRAGAPKVFLQTDTPHAGTFLLPEYRRAVLEFMNRNRF